MRERPGKIVPRNPSPVVVVFALGKALRPEDLVEGGGALMCRNAAILLSSTDTAARAFSKSVSDKFEGLRAPFVSRVFGIVAGGFVKIWWQMC